MNRPKMEEEEEDSDNEDKDEYEGRDSKDFSEKIQGEDEEKFSLMNYKDLESYFRSCECIFHNIMLNDKLLFVCKDRFYKIDRLIFSILHTNRNITDNRNRLIYPLKD